MSDLSPMKAGLFAVALLMLTACGDPLTPETQWLAGRWEWTSSCCTLAGQRVVPGVDHTLTIELHHNGEADLHAVYGDIGDDRTIHYGVDIARGGSDTLIRFDYPIFGRTHFKVTRTAADTVAFIDNLIQCGDCPNIHELARVP